MERAAPAAHGVNRHGVRPAGAVVAAQVARPPDLEELLRRGQDRLKSVLGGGGSGGGGGAASIGAKGITLGALVALGLWLFTGVYRVEPTRWALSCSWARWPISRRRA